jgi:hypothetical protein
MMAFLPELLHEHIGLIYKGLQVGEVNASARVFGHW